VQIFKTVKLVHLRKNRILSLFGIF